MPSPRGRHGTGRGCRGCSCSLSLGEQGVAVMGTSDPWQCPPPPQPSILTPAPHPTPSQDQGDARLGRSEDTPPLQGGRHHVHIICLWGRASSDHSSRQGCAFSPETRGCLCGHTFWRHQERGEEGEAAVRESHVVTRLFSKAVDGSHQASAPVCCETTLGIYNPFLLTCPGPPSPEPLVGCRSGQDGMT